ncbi:MAG: hypothetical protein MK101_05610 [Phycisphaerales bacterium]|nr:hypothetical protein [Phycisphaerales bacterium]
MLELLLAGCIVSGDDSQTWSMDVASSGGDMFWQSSGTIRTDAEDYGCSIWSL